MQHTMDGYTGLAVGGARGQETGLASEFLARFGQGTKTSGRARYSLADRVMDRIAPCPWPATSGSVVPMERIVAPMRRPLYTAEERVRRDATSWTLVQGILAPVQFLVFLVSLGLVLNFLATGGGYEAATLSIVAKTLVLYTIMITGAIWEKKVFGMYLFAPAFFWEDAFSMIVIALHSIYLFALLTGRGSADELMILTLAAYAAYVINATQFILKLRAARLDAATAR